MLDDVAVYLLVAPFAATILVLVGLALWLFRAEMGGARLRARGRHHRR
jgi:hypothetical protein